MNKPRLLDLFCGAGGATKGYQRAGFYVVGIDNRPQPHYCGDDFIQADALNPPVDLFRFNLIHASPPCQVHSKTKHLAGAQHKDLIGATRALLRPHQYVIENVPGAPLQNPVAINGFYVGLNHLDRERWFECSLNLPFLLLPQAHKRPVKMGRPVKDGDIIQVVGHFSDVSYARKAMGIDWMTQKELAQAIPPAYTEWIGNRIKETYLS